MLEKRRNKNNLLITGLLITIFAMVVGYAALSATLSVNGQVQLPVLHHLMLSLQE